MQVIQSFRREAANEKRFRRLNHENYQAGMAQIHILAVFMPLVEVLGVITVAIIILYGGGRILSGDMTLGILVAFISYLRMFFRPIRDLSEKYNLPPECAGLGGTHFPGDGQHGQPPPPGCRPGA
jgi:ATP-binding cassette subfamily B multidrug efflux pump